MEVETAALGVSFESHVRRPSTANVGDHSWIHPRRRNFLATSRDDLKDQTDRCVQEALSLTPHAQIGLPTSKSQVHTLPSDALCMPLDFFPMHSTPSEGRAAAQLEKRPPESRKSGEMVGEVSLCATHAPQLRENQTQATSGSSISGQCENALEDQSFGLSGIETEDDAYDLGDTRGSACKKAHRGWSPSSNKGSSDDYNLSDLLAAAEDNKSSVLGQSTAREQDQSDPRPAIPPDAIAPSAPAIAQRREVCLRSSVLVPMPCLAEKMCGRSVTACSDVSSMEVNLSVEAVCARLRLPAEVAIICRSELRISRLHDWQASCLALPGVGDGHSLVFSSPTSGGKSLVAELLLARMLVRKSGKAIVILPFVSLVEEVAERLSRLLSPIVSKAFTAGVGRKRRRARPVKVEACHGSRHSVGFDACDVAVCTIEKAHVIINRLVMEGRLAELKMVVVDEVHMLSDPSRGYLLELVLSKLRFVDVHAATRASMLHGARPRGAMLNEDEVDAGNNQRAVAVRAHLDHPIEYEPPRQLVLMSATLTNGRELAIWLGAVFFEANWRPVTLQQYVKFGDRLARFDSTCCALRWDSSHEDVRVLSPLTDDDPSHLAMLCAEITHGVASSAVASGAQATSSIIPIARAPITSGDVLVFCPTKKAAEGAAMHLARSYAVAALGAPDEVLEQRSRLLAHLARLAPAMSGQTPWLDVLRTTLPHGVAFHHAGLSIEARELIEAGFRRPATICILCCTSTLAAGVNLPCQRVLITTCLWYGASNIRGRRALSAGASPSAWLTDPASSMEKSFITPASHRQMSGRAGRMGLAERGDAILFVNSSAEAASAEAMLRAPPDPVRSRMVAGAPEVVRRFALETVACGQANDSDKLLRALRCTMAYAQLASAAEVEALTASLKTELMYLVKLRFLEHDASTRAWAPTPLGRAVYTSGLHPDEAAALHEALQGALARFRCADDLHLVLQLTPPRQVEEAFASEERWESLNVALDRLNSDQLDLAHSIGVHPEYVQLMCHHPGRGMQRSHYDAACARFWAALLLRKLSHGHSVHAVAVLSGVAVGVLQGLQAAAATFAGQVKAFCYEAGYHSFADVVGSWQLRMEYGGKEIDIEPLMRIKGVRDSRARQLARAGFSTVERVARASEPDLLKALIRGEATSSAMRGEAAEAILIAAVRKMQRHARRLLALDSASGIGPSDLRLGVGFPSRRSTLRGSSQPERRTFPDACSGVRRGLPFELIHAGERYGTWEAVVAEWEGAAAFSWAALTADDGNIRGLAICWRADVVYWVPFSFNGHWSACRETYEDHFLQDVRRVFSKSARKATYGAAGLLSPLLSIGVRVAPPLIDVQVAGGLLWPLSNRPFDLISLASSWLGPSSSYVTISPSCTGHELAAVRASQILLLMHRLALPLTNARLHQPCRALCDVTTAALMPLGCGVLPISIATLERLHSALVTRLRALDLAAAEVCLKLPLSVISAEIRAQLQAPSEWTTEMSSLPSTGAHPFGGNGVSTALDSSDVPSRLSETSREIVDALLKFSADLNELGPDLRIQGELATERLLLRLAPQEPLARLLLEQRWITIRVRALRHLARRASTMAKSIRGDGLLGATSRRMGNEESGETNTSAATCVRRVVHLPLALAPDPRRGGLSPADEVMVHFFPSISPPNPAILQEVSMILEPAFAHSAIVARMHAAASAPASCPLGEGQNKDDGHCDSFSRVAAIPSAHPDVQEVSPADGDNPVAVMTTVPKFSHTPKLYEVMQIPSYLAKVEVELPNILLVMLAHHSGDPNLAWAARATQLMSSAPTAPAKSRAVSSFVAPLTPEELPVHRETNPLDMVAFTAARIFRRPALELSAREIDVVRYAWEALFAGYLCGCKPPEAAGGCGSSLDTSSGMLSTFGQGTATPSSTGSRPNSFHRMADPVWSCLCAAFPSVADLDQKLRTPLAAVTTVGGRPFRLDPSRPKCVFEREQVDARLLGMLCEASARDISVGLLCRLSPILDSVAIPGYNDTLEASGVIHGNPRTNSPETRAHLLTHTASALLFAVPLCAVQNLKATLPSAATSALHKIAYEYGIELPVSAAVRVADTLERPSRP